MNLRASVRGRLKKTDDHKVDCTEVVREPRTVQTRSKKIAVNDQPVKVTKPKPSHSRSKPVPIAQKPESRVPEKNVKSNFPRPKPKDKKTKVPASNVTKSPVKRVTRSKLSKNKVVSPTKTAKMSQDKCEGKSVPDQIVQLETNEPMRNPITNYFKIDQTPKEERMKKNLLIKSSRKSVCWASVSLQKSPDKSEDDPYEFVADTPKRKKSQRKVYRKTPAPSKPRNKIYKMDLNEPSLPIEKPPAMTQTNSAQEKSTPSEETLPTVAFNMEISSINITSNRLSSQCKTVNVTEDTEITPVKNVTEKGVFKTPSLPLKATENNLNFFSKAAAISTPKVLNPKAANEPAKKAEETYAVEKSLSIIESTPKPKSPSKELPIKNMETFVVTDSENILPETLKAVSSQTVDISPINEASNTPEHSQEADIYDNIDEENFEDDCILSGSFVDCDKFVYENEDLNRASTPDNASMTDRSLNASGSAYFSRNYPKDGLGNPNTSINPDPFSLYGSPIQLSPVRARDSEEEEGDENYKLKILPAKKIAKKKSFKSKLNFSSKKKPLETEIPSRKRKREEPKNPAFEKWLKTFNTEINEAEKTVLIVE